MRPGGNLLEEQNLNPKVHGVRGYYSLYRSDITLFHSLGISAIILLTAFRCGLKLYRSLKIQNKGYGFLHTRRSRRTVGAAHGGSPRLQPGVKVLKILGFSPGLF